MNRLIQAAVLSETAKPLDIEEVELEGSRDDEVVVRLSSVGVCRSDTHALTDVAPPAVLGHEGAGTVAEVGSAVRQLAAGDAVVMTFRSCGHCPRCLTGQPAYCDSFLALNFSGERPDGTSALSRPGGHGKRGRPLYGHFLGQSSFATYAVAHERSVVRLEPGTELSALGPFGCGFQTGAGAVLNALRPPAGSSLVVCGAGAVGLAAIAAARLSGCSPIVALDVSSSRLETALRLGASDVLDTQQDGWPDTLAALVPGGLDYAIDTTGLPAIVRQAVACLHTRGVCGVVGAGSASEMSLDWRTMLNGRTVTGIIAGNSVPQVFLPQLVDLYRTGRFPIDELITYYPFAEIGEAIAASERGEVIKPVLTFS